MAFEGWTWKEWDRWLTPAQVAEIVGAPESEIRRVAKELDTIGRGSSLRIYAPSLLFLEVVPPEIGWIYFIGTDWRSPVKIGWATDVEKRRKDLQTANPTELRVLAKLEGTRQLEGLFHRQLGAKRIRGEWFDGAAALTAYWDELDELAEAA